MFHRILKPLPNQSYFLFGPRGTGKSTFLQTQYGDQPSLYIDLLEVTTEDTYLRTPQALENRVLALPKTTRWIIIDEVQKAPRLLDVVHRLIESSDKLFILTGSSARKLKRGASNLLAGRAFVYALHPLTHRELENAFVLQDILQWGSLPKIFQFTTKEEKATYLRAYALTYLKEEIVAEQIVRRLDPFRQFLEVAAQCNGQILNFTKVSRDIGVDTKTTQSFFKILEDTLIGTLLPAYHQSIRKRQRTQPKFYFFDLGVKRSLERSLEQDLSPRTWVYGQAFEHFVIMEILRLASYQKPDWRFSYLRTKDDAEVDLIIDRPGLPIALLEIKSSDRILENDITNLARFKRDMSNSQAFCFSQDPNPQKFGAISCLPWQQGLVEIGL